MFTGFSCVSDGYKWLFVTVVDGYNGGIVGEIGPQVAIGVSGADPDAARLDSEAVKLAAKPIKVERFDRRNAR